MAAAGVVSAEIPKSVEGGDDLLLSRYKMLDSWMIEAEMHAVNALAVARMLMGSGGTVIVLWRGGHLVRLAMVVLIGSRGFYGAFHRDHVRPRLGPMSLGLVELEILQISMTRHEKKRVSVVLLVYLLVKTNHVVAEIFSLMSRDEGRDAGVEAIGQIEELLSEVRVIEFKGNHIRLLLKTPIPSMDILPQQYNSASFIEPAIVDHELMIEVLENNLEPMNLEVNLVMRSLSHLAESRELMVKARRAVGTISKAL
ncbi:hypothetical protein J5N97_004953 [Dioscorea zingiberensis]|uniref:Uncharacterized protein n=1 Tax=Dioscorea zingiberensis TaxID=325984 RepID=A0A9D5HSN6_9LILI|nr:hypothetical protein J5N97_004953 [Dioscorea zingiberensis]